MKLKNTFFNFTYYFEKLMVLIIISIDNICFIKKKNDILDNA